MDGVDEISTKPSQQPSVEVFLGENPLPDNSKAVQEFDITSIRTELKSLPSNPSPSMVKRVIMDRFDIPLKYFENYNLFEVGSNNASNNATVINDINAHNLTHQILVQGSINNSMNNASFGQ